MRAMDDYKRRSGRQFPTWSEVLEVVCDLGYRKVAAPLLAAGYRCVMLDQPGFGRSDKPTDLGWYSYDRHTEAAKALVAELRITGATFVVQDWGGPIGLRTAIEVPGAAARLVILDTGLFTGHQHMSDAWIAFRDFVERTDDLPIEMLVRGACANDPGDAVIAAYGAPFPVPEAKAGARAFPLMLPTTPDAPGARAGQETLEKLAASDLPTLMLWADGDPILTLETGRRFATAIGVAEPETIANASHFLQEDQGEQIGNRILAWLASDD